jgi:hypothetical protein
MASPEVDDLPGGVTRHEVVALREVARLRNLLRRQGVRPVPVSDTARYSKMLTLRQLLGEIQCEGESHRLLERCKSIAEELL